MNYNSYQTFDYSLQENVLAGKNKGQHDDIPMDIEMDIEMDIQESSGNKVRIDGHSQGGISGENLNGEGENQELAEQIAIQVLGGLKQPFLQRVSNIPLVNRTVSSISNAYTTTKNSNNVLKYSAESVESLSSMISKPVLSTLEPVLGPLDRFASNQLDKVERKFPSLRSNKSCLNLNANHTDGMIQDDILPPLKMHLLDDPEMVSLPGIYAAGKQNQAESFDASNDIDVSDVDMNHDDVPSQDANQEHHSTSVEPKQESKWALVRLGADTIRALHYCLSFLKYAINNMGQQISILQQALMSKGNPETQRDFLSLLSRVKREIVETLRNAVDMLGRYSSSYLPVDARHSVRLFILSLPSRFATMQQPNSPAPLELEMDQYQEEGRKVMALASESTNMLENVHNVFSTTVSAAEYTLGRSDEYHETLPDGIPKFRSRYSSNTSEITVTAHHPYGDDREENN